MTYVNRPDQLGTRSKDGGRATVRWVFADSSARTNFTPLHSSPNPSAYDIGSEAWQLSDDSFWSLKSIAPNVWVAKGSGGGALTPDASATNASIPHTGSGAALTVDLAIAANTRVTVTVYAFIKDTTAGKTRYIAEGKVVVVRDAGAPVIGNGGSPRSYYSEDDTASIYSTDVNPVALYGALSISGNNLRFTIAQHATNDQKANVAMYANVVAMPV